MNNFKQILKAFKLFYFKFKFDRILKLKVTKVRIKYFEKLQTNYGNILISYELKNPKIILQP